MPICTEEAVGLELVTSLKIEAAHDAEITGCHNLLQEILFPPSRFAKPEALQLPNTVPAHRQLK